MPENEKIQKSIQKGIQENIPTKPKIFGFYDEEEERWIRLQVGTTIEGIRQISEFVKVLTKEVERIRKLLSLEKIDFVLEVNVGGYGLDFDAVINEDFKANRFIEKVMSQIKRTSRTSRLEKPEAKFVKLNLTF